MAQEKASNSLQWRVVDLDLGNLLYGLKACLSDGRSFVVAQFTRKPVEADILAASKRLVDLAVIKRAEKHADRFLPEVLSYVRHLPAPCRPSGIDDKDADRAAAIREDIRSALIKALTQNDPFRAAVVFENRVPFLIGDIHLVENLKRIIDDLTASTDLMDVIAKAAEDEEARLFESYPFTKHLVESCKDSTGQDPFRTSSCH